MIISHLQDGVAQLLTIVSPLRGLRILTIIFDRKLRKLAYGYLRVLPLRG